MIGLEFEMKKDVKELKKKARLIVLDWLNERIRKIELGKVIPILLAVILMVPVLPYLRNNYLFLFLVVWFSKHALSHLNCKATLY